MMNRVSVSFWRWPLWLNGMLLGALLVLAGAVGWNLAAARGAWVAVGLALLVVIAWVDWQRWVIPGPLVGTGVASVLGLRALLAPETLPDALAAGVLGWLLFWLLAYLGQGDLGYGDVRLAGFIGVLTGLPWVIPALLLGMLLGGVMAFVLAVSGRARMDEGFPYGPALSLGAVLVLVRFLMM